MRKSDKGIMEGLLETLWELMLVTIPRNFINLRLIPDWKGFEINIKSFWTDQKSERILEENAEGDIEIMEEIVW